MIIKRFTLFKNLSIRTRLYFGGVVALIGLLGIGGAGYFGLVQSNAALTDSIIATTAVSHQKQADMMHDALRADVLFALLEGPEGATQNRREVEADLLNHADEFNANIAALASLPLDANIRAELDKVIPLAQAYITAALDVGATAFVDRTAAQLKWGPFMEAFRLLEVEMGTMGDTIGAQGNVASTAAQNRNHVLIQELAAAVVICTALLTVSIFWLSRSITAPIAQIRDAISRVVDGELNGRHSSFDRASDLNDDIAQIAVYLEDLRIRLRDALEMQVEVKRTQADQQVVVNALTIGLQRLSAGNLTNRIDQPFSSEYEGLRANYNQTIDQLNQTMGQVVEASRSIRARADDITNASTDLAQRTENQAATLEETAASLDQLTTSVKAAATGAKEVETIVQHARQEAEDNGKVVLRAVDAMNGIERSSEQISRIIGVIDDIAFQTNLLALNAGVEAARAGDSGRGFAVVASEVRALAQRSSDASKEIKDLISTTSALVGRGVEAVGSAGRALTNLAERVTHISTLVSGIATGASQQSTALAEVNIGVTQLDQVAQRNAAMVEQSMATTQSLQSEAFGMDRLMSRFTTQTPAQGAPTAPAKLRVIG